jgi:broad specificity phosphatase PhoE
MIRLGLIRHAMTQWNFEKKIQGREDIKLNPEGMSQAAAWGKILSPEKFDLILSSTMIRAQQTAQIISEKINVVVEYDIDLREQDFGEWEGKKIKDIRKNNPNQIEAQESRGWQFCPPGGESRINILNRTSGAIENAAQKFDNKYILIVTHNSVIKTLIYKVMDRKFIPGEPALLKDYHLHTLVFDKTLEIERLNSVNLRDCL